MPSRATCAACVQLLLTVVNLLLHLHLVVSADTGHALTPQNFLSPPPNEVVNGLRNPTLDQFLPKRRRAAAPEVRQRLAPGSCCLRAHTRLPSCYEHVEALPSGPSHPPAPHPSHPWHPQTPARTHMFINPSPGICLLPARVCHLHALPHRGPGRAHHAAVSGSYTLICLVLRTLTPLASSHALLFL